MDVEIRSSASGGPPPARVRRLLGRANRATGNHAREVSVLFCGDRLMAGLNRRWRGKDRSTDVLAFPAEAIAPGFLGDIVISIPYASRQAHRRREPRAREIDRLLLHGYLHLLGYDHETDSGQMDALEARLKKRFGIAEKTESPG
ncbi:MAG: rRNA maturation RNase YbeY [Acidobacteriota bacterium]|nr:rRNA maturation RNase YbeY [Acidobacteriota bacterium]MDQ5871687.1 rRNA maturation RNase YbeY [Acidobacteriota bacterium]